MEVIYNLRDDTSLILTIIKILFIYLLFIIENDRDSVRIFVF